MNYLRNLGKRIREAVPPDLVPAGEHDLLFDLYAALALCRGVATTEREVHDAWVVWMLSQGEQHPSMVPFEELPPETQARDRPFVDAIRAVADELR